MYPSASSNSNGVIGPGLPIGCNRGLFGSLDILPSFIVGAADRACAIMLRWYSCNLRLISDDFLSCPGRSFDPRLLVEAGMDRLVGGSGARGVEVGVDTSVEVGDL